MARGLPILTGGGGLRGSVRGRGSAIDPPNRFERIVLEPDGDTVDELARGDDGPEPSTTTAGRAPGLGMPARLPTQYFRDASRSIIAYNDSPDVGFNASINPYRGCEHGCAYCYARPFHEYLGLSAGLDFETKILVKLDAPELLRRALSARAWRPQVLALSGVTDAYQPVERRLRITRRCLEVLAAFRNPVGVVTKGALVTRDVDLLAELARFGAARVHVSVTTLRNDLSAAMEPRASAPVARLGAIAALAKAGVPVGVFVSPVIAGLTDHEMPSILRAAADAGARWAAFIPLRLPGAVQAVFADWLGRHVPERAGKVLNRVRAMRGGRLNDPRFHARFRASGVFADQLGEMFHAFREKHGLAKNPPALETAHFRVPGQAAEPGLFDGFEAGKEARPARPTGCA